jgi:hypothetical protein
MFERLPERSHKTVLSLLLAVAMLGVSLMSAQTNTAPSTPVIGSANTVTAEPHIPRPETTPCRVQLFSNFVFADFSGKPFAYTPPARCSGPWSKAVLEADFSVDAGRQFDRTANIWIGGTNIYFGTTAEPSRTVARSWHIESDLTEYSALFTQPQSGQVILGNLVNSTYTSSLHGSADLAFYPAESDDDHSRTADLVLPLSAGPNGGTVALFSPTDALSGTFTLPRNIERAYLDVYAQAQGANDEFWYTCVPNNLANELLSCSGTGFRETEITLDGQPAGVAPVYPWIYTGGIDPYLWRPIPGVQTLNFTPFRVDLTPFAGMLSNGQSHQIALSIYNNSQYFQTTASLLLYLDRESQQVTGGVTKNTLGSGPNPVVSTNLNTAPDGTITGTVTVTSSRHYTIAGEVDTSHGKVRTKVSQKIDFSNAQQFTVPTGPSNYVQDITQRTSIRSETVTDGPGGHRVHSNDFEWPLTVNITAPPDGSFSTTIDQRSNRVETEEGGDSPRYFRVVVNHVAPTDNYPSNQGQANSQEYFSTDSRGSCYSRAITAAGGILTRVTDQALCPER